MEINLGTAYFGAFFLVLLAFSVAQQEPYRKPVAILTEQRYLSGNGQFGAAYTQEDGINFKEETDADGTRHGSYSYIDPSGQRRQISYTAGRNGFQPSGSDVLVPKVTLPQRPPAPQYGPNPNNQAYSSNYQDNNDYEDGSYDPRYNNPNFVTNTRPNIPKPVYSPSPNINYNRNSPTPIQEPDPRNWQPEPPRAVFRPPGKFSLNRTPDGFSYSFRHT